MNLTWKRTLRTASSERFLALRDGKDLAAVDLHYLANGTVAGTVIILQGAGLDESNIEQLLSALDDESWASACDVLTRVQRTTRVTVLHVTHRHEESRRLADVAIELHAGRLTATIPRSPQEALPR